MGLTSSLAHGHHEEMADLALPPPRTATPTSLTVSQPHSGMESKQRRSAPISLSDQESSRPPLFPRQTRATSNDRILYQVNNTLAPRRSPALPSTSPASSLLTINQPPSQSQSASVPPSVSVWNVRRSQLFAVIVILSITLLTLPLYYLSTSSSLSALFCAQSVVTPQAASAMKMFVAYHEPSMLGVTSFTLPRYSDGIFVSAVPDPIEPFDVQLSQWLNGPLMALTHNLSYVYTPFLRHSARWSKWLGFGYGEDSEDDLYASYSRLRYFQRNVNDDKQDDALELNAWLSDKHSTAVAINRQTMESYVKTLQIRQKSEQQKPIIVANIDEASAIVRSTVSEPKGSRLEGASTRHIDSTTIINTANIIRLYHVKIATPQHACLPVLRSLLRQKYCAARIRTPVKHALYDSDRRNQRLIVAMEIECGAVCFDGSKATSVTSIIHTVTQLCSLSQSKRLPMIAFHLFASSPLNETAVQHFGSLLHGHSYDASVVKVHDTLHSHALLHHLIASDVLIYNPHSPMSWLAVLLHDGIVVTNIATGPRLACGASVTGYNRHSGTIDGDELARAYQRWSGNGTLRASRMGKRFDSLQDCHAIQHWHER